MCELVKHIYSYVWVAEWSERSPRNGEVAGSSPGRAITKALNVVLVVSVLYAKH